MSHTRHGAVLQIAPSGKPDLVPSGCVRGADANFFETVPLAEVLSTRPEDKVFFSPSDQNLRNSPLFQMHFQTNVVSLFKIIV